MAWSAAMKTWRRPSSVLGTRRSLSDGLTSFLTIGPGRVGVHIWTSISAMLLHPLVSVQRKGTITEMKYDLW